MCDYCENPEPCCDCCYYDPDKGYWVEQKLECKENPINKDGSVDIMKLFGTAYVSIRRVDHCPECGRVFSSDFKNSKQF